MTDERGRWAMGLYRRSPLKRAKFEAIKVFLGEVQGKRCLDLGGDNGVISYLLRRQGGDWWSADLGAAQVAAIRELVGDRVRELHGPTLPFPDRAFDVVVVADLLEHVEADHLLVAELARVLEPGGVLIVNVPHLKPHSVLGRLRELLGVADAWHGHVRPGYTLRSLTTLLQPYFEVVDSRTYARGCSEGVDVILNAVRRWSVGARSQTASGPSKGGVVMYQDVATLKRQFRLMGYVAPVLWAVSRLDVLLVGQAGYRLIVKARRLAQADQGDRPAGEAR